MQAVQQDHAQQEQWLKAEQTRTAEEAKRMAEERKYAALPVLLFPFVRNPSPVSLCVGVGVCLFELL